jgi:tRNA (guanine37-N1)-methyltransferase
MILKPEPIFKAVESIRQDNSYVILLSPQGRALNQDIVNELSQKEHIVMICGRYKGVDERVREHLINDEISIGDYVLSGGEAASLALVFWMRHIIPDRRIFVVIKYRKCSFPAITRK